MGKHQAVTAALDTETLSDLQRLASHMNCSVDHLVTTAVLRFVNDEIGAITPDEFAHLPPFVSTDPTSRALAEAQERYDAAFDAFVQVGEDDLAAGRSYSQEEVEAMFKVRQEGRNAA